MPKAFGAALVVVVVVFAKCGAHDLHSFLTFSTSKKGEGRQGNHLGQGGEFYIISSTAAFSGEIMKLIVSVVVALSQLLGQDRSLRNALIMCILATLHSFQNVLQHVAATNLDASLCQVLYQMKLLTTTLSSVVMLGRQLTRSQWLGILKQERSLQSLQVFELHRIS